MNEKIGVLTAQWDEPQRSSFMVLAGYVSNIAATTANIWMDYYPEILMFCGLVLLLCGAAMGIRYIWQRWIRYPARGLWNKVVRNPTSWLLKPVRRLHHRYSDRSQRAKMAKWKKGHLADVFFNALLVELTEHRITAGDFKQLKNKMADFFDVPDLKGRKTHPDAVKNQNEKTKKRLREQPLAGPAKAIPGGKPGENVVPIYEGLGHKFLLKRKSA